MSGVSEIEREAVHDIADLAREFLDESMSDPDIAGRSDDYREGYRLGFAEAMAAAVALMIAQKERRT